MLTQHWKTEISDLRNRARAVQAPSSDRLSARAAARCLSGVVNEVVRRHGQDEMQRACADLVRYDAAWSTMFGTLPRGVEGIVPPAIHLIAVVARGILPLAGAENMRAALSFWACEDDPAVWQEIAA